MRATRNRLTRTLYIFMLVVVSISCGKSGGGGSSGDCRMNAEQSYVGLGDLRDGFFASRGNGISADGHVVVGQGDSASGMEAFIWEDTGTCALDNSGVDPCMVGLGELPGAPFFSRANGTSTDGTVVVGQSASASGSEAFRWTAVGGMVGLGDLPTSPFFSLANDTSADGSVVVGEGTVIAGSQAFRWQNTGTCALNNTGTNPCMVGLGDLPGGFFDSRATGTSDDGTVVVGQGASASGVEAFRWQNTGTCTLNNSGMNPCMVGLGDLPGGIFRSSATGTSADGGVVIGLSVSTSGSEAFRWTAADGMVGLGDLPGGIFRSVATGISADGSIVVGKSESESGADAFIWDAANGMRKLDEVLSGLCELKNWTRLGANAVSDDGRVIVGDGINPDGDLEAWIAVVPQGP